MAHGVVFELEASTAHTDGQNGQDPQCGLLGQPHNIVLQCRLYRCRPNNIVFALARKKYVQIRILGANVINRDYT